MARDLRSRAAIVLRRRYPTVWRGQTPEPRRNSYETLMANPFQFLQDVRSEGAKITWPSRRETLITTGLVLAMVFVASLFFVSVDQTLRLIVGFLLSLGR